MEIVGPYRCVCIGCSRKDYDGVDQLPQDWGELFLQRKDSNYSHGGLCPDCRRKLRQAETQGAESHGNP